MDQIRSLMFNSKNAFVVVSLLSALAMVLSLAGMVVADEVAKPDEHFVYQSKPLVNPKGGEKFAGSNFIHPLRTPSGFVVTDCQPSDHLHHFGLWWPWKYLKVGDEKVLFWELQQGEGIIQTVDYQKTKDGFIAKSIYLDKKSADKPQVVLNETVECVVSPVATKPVSGYDLDVKITQQVVGGQSVEVVKYRYSGFTFRGTPAWKNANSSLLTSDGKTRKDSNGSTARWVRMEGDSQEGKKAGVLLMTAPTNHAHPEKLRTWNDKMMDGALFVNMNTVQKKPWILESNKSYTRNFRVHVYDGTLSKEQADSMWQRYAKSFEKAP